MHRPNAGPLASQDAADMHEAGVVPATQTSASVSRMRASLSVSIAIDVSAFLTANVPPNPQQPERVTRRMQRHAVRERRADVLDVQAVAPQFGELEQPAAEVRAVLAQK